MSEQFVDIPDDQPSTEYDTPRMLDELTMIDIKRMSILRTTGELTVPVISHKIDQIAFDYGPDGDIKIDIDLLSGCVAAVQSQLLTLESKIELIESEKSEPQQIYAEATLTLTAIHDRKKMIVRQIRELEAQRTTIENQKKIQDLKLEKDVTSDMDRRSAQDGQLYAEHEIARLDEALAIVLLDVDTRIGMLGQYSAAIDRLREKVDVTEAALIDVIKAVDAVAIVVDEGAQNLDIPLPEKLSDIEIHMTSRPVSYGEYVPVRGPKIQRIAEQALELPEDMINFTDDSSIISVDVPYVYEKPPQPEPQRSLGSLLREAREKSLNSGKVGRKAGIWKK